MMRSGRGHDSDDHGFTMLEVTVAMTLFSIFLAIFGGAMVNMFNSTTRTQQTAYAQSGRNQVYLKLDRQVRYASGLSSPGLDKEGNPTVEWSNTYGGDQVCTQLRLVDGTLQSRSWTQPQDTNTSISMGPTAVLGSGLRAGTPSAIPTVAPNTDVVVSGPFATLAANGDASNQRLEIAVVAYQDETPKADIATRPRTLNLTFTALNTGTSTSSAAVCSAGRSIAWPSPSA